MDITRWIICSILLLQRRDAVIVVTGNVLTAFFARFVIFGVIGFMVFELRTTVNQVLPSFKICLLGVGKASPVGYATHLGPDFTSTIHYTGKAIIILFLS